MAIRLWLYPSVSTTSLAVAIGRDVHTALLINDAYEGFGFLGRSRVHVCNALLRNLPRHTNTYILHPVRVEKPLRWLGSSVEDVRAFPAEARRAAGYQLGRVQQGLMPDDWKPMTVVGSGVCEIRIHARGERRVFYVAKFEEAIYVVHAFEKRTRRTLKTDIDVARKRLADLLRLRARRQEVL